MQVIGSVFTGGGKPGDFGWMLRQTEYDGALFIFNDNEEQFRGLPAATRRAGAAARPVAATPPSGPTAARTRRGRPASRPARTASATQQPRPTHVRGVDRRGDRRGARPAWPRAATTGSSTAPAGQTVALGSGIFDHRRRREGVHRRRAAQAGGRLTRGALRRHRRRRRVGRRRARGPALGGPGHLGAAARGGARPHHGRPRRRACGRPTSSAPWRSRAASGPTSWPPASTARSPRSYVRGRGAGGSSSVNAMGAIRGTDRRLRALGQRAGLHRLGLARDARRVPAASRTTPTTAVTASTAGAARSRSTRQPLDAVPPLDRALRLAHDRPRLPDLRRLPPPRRHRHQPLGAHAARRPPRLHQRRLPRPGPRPAQPRRCGATRWSTGCCSTAAEPPACAWPPARRSRPREVIVSAGAIHSPAILLRSGIGVGDGLPVGANLKDHAATPGFELALRDRTPAWRRPTRR